MSPTASKKNPVIVLILVFTGLAVTLYWWKAVHPYETTDNAYLKAHSTLISSKQSGYVKRVSFQDNQTIKAGELLVEIDDHDYQARVAQMEAQLLMEQARLQTLQTRKRSQTAKIHQEDANIQTAEAELHRISKDVQRFTNLAIEGAISEQTRDSAESAHTQSRAQLDKTRSAKQQAESDLAALDMELQEAQARIKAANANLELARIELSQTHIHAPVDGIVGNRSVQVGQLLKPGSVLAYLVPSEAVFIEANFKETQIAAMQAGQAVDIHIDAYPERIFNGRIDSFAPASGSEFSLLPSENATGNFTKIVRRVPVKITFEPGTDLEQLKPGLSTVVKVKVR